MPTLTLLTNNTFINAGTVQTIQFRLPNTNFDLSGLNMSGNALGTALLNDFFGGAAGEDRNELYGGNDDDLLQMAPRLAAGDIYDGGSGIDTLSFAGLNFGYVVNLTTQSADFSAGGFPVSVIGIENVIGAELGDKKRKMENSPKLGK